jgi:predicted SnoaL-like aldol condensation-catalyzing enzyme
MPNIQYIADHIDRIERRHGGNESLILNSKWRIASNAELFEDLNPNGSLTPQQVAAVDSYIQRFKQTAEGQQAIAFYQRMVKAPQESNLETLFALAFQGDA